MLFRSLRVRDLMTVDVESVPITARPSQVRDLLRRRPYHHVPVVDGTRLVGIVSAVDIALVSLGGYVHDQGTVDAHLDAAFDLAKLISVDVLTVRPDDSAAVAADRLSSGAFHALPVVDAEGALVGILTSTDLVRWLATQG
jgi:CBS domain-containing membrane protein